MTDVVMVAAPTQARTFQTVSPRGRTTVRERKRIIADVRRCKCIFLDFGKDWRNRDPLVVKLKVLCAGGRRSVHSREMRRSSAHGGTLTSERNSSFHPSVAFPIAETEKLAASEQHHCNNGPNNFPAR